MSLLASRYDRAAKKRNMHLSGITSRAARSNERAAQIAVRHAVLSAWARRFALEKVNQVDERLAAHREALELERTSRRERRQELARLVAAARASKQKSPALDLEGHRPTPLSVPGVDDDESGLDDDSDEEEEEASEEEMSDEEEEEDSDDDDADEEEEVDEEGEKKDEVKEQNENGDIDLEEEAEEETEEEEEEESDEEGSDEAESDEEESDEEESDEEDVQRTTEDFVIRVDTPHRLARTPAVEYVALTTRGGMPAVNGGRPVLQSLENVLHLQRR